MWTPPWLVKEGGDLLVEKKLRGSKYSSRVSSLGSTPFD